MDRKLRQCLSALVLSTAICVPGLVAQQETSRKIVSRVEPRYPEMAKKMGLAGTVRIQVTVNPAGSVKAAKVLGGSPILADSALEAVKKWKFERSGEETTETIIFNFRPVTA